jgi:hypothetical protein
MRLRNQRCWYLPEIDWLPFGRNSRSRTDVDSDFESVLSEAEWKALESMTNMREFAYDDWVKEVFQGRIDEGPPMALVAARTYIEMCAGQVHMLNGVEQYRIPYVQVPNAEACTPIILPKRIRVRVIRYSDPARWRPKGNWGNGRRIHWTRKTKRPFGMWPKVWDRISDKVKHFANGNGVRRSNAEL